MTAAECVKKMLARYGKVPEVWKAKSLMPKAFNEGVGDG